MNYQKGDTVINLTLINDFTNNILKPVEERKSVFGSIFMHAIDAHFLDIN